MVNGGPLSAGALLSAVCIGKIGSNVNYLLELCAALASTRDGADVGGRSGAAMSIARRRGFRRSPAVPS